MTKCKGCGIKLQNENEKALGYTPNMDNKLCVRCFKLKNYNVLINKGIKIDNTSVLNSINKKGAFVLFLVDFLNMDKEVFDTFNKITCDKVLVITKSDTIPKNILIDKLIANIKRVYGIKEDIILCSSKFKKNISIINNICSVNKKVLLAGFTNAGKSSLINALVDSDITVSKKENTTQDFISIKMGENEIIDAPGFISNTKKEAVPNTVIKPRTYQLKDKYYLKIGAIKLKCQKNSNITIYVTNDTLIEKRVAKENIVYNGTIKKGQDLVLKGIGFIKFSTDASFCIDTNYEIRDTIVGGNNE